MGGVTKTGGSSRQVREGKSRKRAKKTQKLKESKHKVPNWQTRVLAAFVFACSKKVFQKKLWPQIASFLLLGDFKDMLFWKVNTAVSSRWNTCTDD